MDLARTAIGLCLCVLVATASGCVAAPPQADLAEPQEPVLFDVEKDGKYGCIDRTGRMVIELRFRGAAIAGFSEGLCVVAVGDKCGVIDKSGSIVVEPAYDQIGDSQEGHAAVRIGTLRGYIDRIGRLIAVPPYSMARDFHEGLAAVYLAHPPSLWGYIDYTGAVAVAPRFAACSNFSEGLALVTLWGPPTRDVQTLATRALSTIQAEWSFARKRRGPISETVWPRTIAATLTRRESWCGGMSSGAGHLA